MPPILYVKVPTNYETKTPLSEFYKKEKIDGPDESAKLEDPFKFEEKECIVNAAVKFESIYIKNNIISLQVRLSEIEISATDERPKRQRKRRRLLTKC